MIQGELSVLSAPSHYPGTRRETCGFLRNNFDFSDQNSSCSLQCQDLQLISLTSADEDGAHAMLIEGYLLIRGGEG